MGLCGLLLHAPFPPDPSMSVVKLSVIHGDIFFIQVEIQYQSPFYLFLCVGLPLERFSFSGKFQTVNEEVYLEWKVFEYERGLFIDTKNIEFIFTLWDWLEPDVVKKHTKPKTKLHPKVDFLQTFPKNKFHHFINEHKWAKFPEGEGELATKSLWPLVWHHLLVIKFR